MNQKNRLLREAFAMLDLIADGSFKPLASPGNTKEVIKLRDRIAKNLNITPEATV